MHKKNIFDLFNEQHPEPAKDPTPGNVVTAADVKQDIVKQEDVKQEDVKTDPADGKTDPADGKTDPADPADKNADETAGGSDV